MISTCEFRNCQNMFF